MQSNISFTAKFISTATVRKFANNGNYIPAEANVVELYTKNKNDLKTLQEIKELWRKPNYAGAICEDAFSANATYEEYRPSFYAITTQKDMFEKLLPEDILGLAETRTTFGAIKSLDFLQTNPEFLKKIKPAIKGIGTQMLAFVEKINKGRRIEANAVPGTEPFYSQNGYRRLSEDSHIFYKDV